MAIRSAARSMEARTRSGDVVRQAGPLDPPALILTRFFATPSLPLRNFPG